MRRACCVGARSYVRAHVGATNTRATTRTLSQAPLFHPHPCTPTHTHPMHTPCCTPAAINSLELWAKVLAAHADDPELRPLIYPVAQLLLGAARLVPTPGDFPLRLR